MNYNNMNNAKDYMLRHWNADEIGTDLNSDTLDSAFEATFGRPPSEDEDTFGMLKAHYAQDLTDDDRKMISEWA